MDLQNPVFIPGPTNIPEVLRKACDMPTIDHRSRRFAEILEPARAGVRRVIKGETAEVMIFPSTGTGGWEVAITNTLSEGDGVLAARHGMFSHRWIDMCERHGLDVTVADAAWGDGVPVDRFAEILTADTGHRIKAVLVTHNETATGVVSDVAGVRRALDAARHPALLFVDGVSSIASMDFRFDEWGVDVAVAGSQKGFMLPPGLAIVGMSARALAARDSAKLKRTFFDTADMQNSYAAGGYPYTPAVGLLNGLKVSCEMLVHEGLEAVFARHARIAGGVRAAVGAWGLELGALRPALYSDSVTAIRVPPEVDAARIVTHAAERYGVAFGTGLGEVSGRVFRIGHLGAMTDVMALAGIATAEMCLSDLGVDVTLGAGTAAAQRHFSATGAPSLSTAA